MEGSVSEEFQVLNGFIIGEREAEKLCGPKADFRSQQSLEPVARTHFPKNSYRELEPYHHKSGVFKLVI